MMRGRAALVGLALLLTACARSAGPFEEDAAPSTGGTSGTTTSISTDVPDVVVRDVATGGDVNLRALDLADRPTLYWFWAPH